MTPEQIAERLYTRWIVERAPNSERQFWAFLRNLAAGDPATHDRVVQHLNRITAPPDQAPPRA